MDYRTLELLRQRHPAWRLLTADHAPLIVGFLHQTFVRPNVRTLSQPELVALLDDYLYALRNDFGQEAFPRAAVSYLDSWAADEHAWLRKYYPASGDEAHFDITPATERVIEARRAPVHRDQRCLPQNAMVRDQASSAAWRWWASGRCSFMKPCLAS